MAAAGRLDQAEQHPDGGGLARPVRAEEAVDGAVRDGEVDGVHRELAAAEALAQPAARDRRLRPASARAAGPRAGLDGQRLCIDVAEADLIPLPGSAVASAHFT